jgi:hypothetical protein
MVWKHVSTAVVLGIASLAQRADAAPVRVGDVAPEFSRLDVSGTTHTLSSYRGQVVLLGLVGYS